MLSNVALTFPKQITNVKVPPLKTQGIKTKLVPFIAENINWSGDGRWLEPFLGSGVVMFNINPLNAIGSESNIHIINFFNQIKSKKITSKIVRKHLEYEGKLLLERGEQYYYEVRDRFNENGETLDFLFLNRADFNGMMRFNSKGKFNVPFCRKPQRFSKSYITKITNQVEWLSCIFQGKNWEFLVEDWKNIVKESKESDFLYLDPPYFGRHANYYDIWTEFDLVDLSELLHNIPCGFALSLWLENKYRKNEYVEKLFSDCTVKTFEHFYHVGPTEDLRNSITEALIINQ